MVCEGMREMRRVCLAVAAALVLGSAFPAGAEIVSSTRYDDFRVNGRNTAEIYRAILGHGPHVDGSKAIATAAATAIQDGRMRQSGGVCRVEDYRIKLKFRIVRPRIVNERALSPADRALWQQFSSFVSKHEEQHTQTWLACARKLDRQVRTIRARSCSQVEARVDALWDRMLSSCDAAQQSFDAAQARELKRQPFMKRALLLGD